MEYKIGNIVMYNGHQAVVHKVYKEDGIEYLDLQQNKDTKIFKVPAEDVYFLFKKRTKSLN